MCINSLSSSRFLYSLFNLLYVYVYVDCMYRLHEVQIIMYAYCMYANAQDAYHAGYHCMFIFLFNLTNLLLIYCMNISAISFCALIVQWESNVTR